jgi:hypothetical protein
MCSTVSIPSTISWPKEWGIDPDTLSEEQLESALVAKFQESRQLYQSFVRHWHELPHLLTLMVTHSWYPDPEISITDTSDLESKAISGDFASIQNYLIDYFRSKADDIERRVCERYPNRAGIVSEAFAAYREGRYVLAIPVFLAQADGISEQLLSKCFFTQGGNVSTERVIVLPGEEFDALIGRPGYHLCENGDLERREGSLVYVMVRQGNRSLPMGE